MMLEGYRQEKVKERAHSKHKQHSVGLLRTQYRMWMEDSRIKVGHGGASIEHN